MNLDALTGVVHSAFTNYTRAFPYERGKRRLVHWLWRPLSFGHFEREVSLDLLDVRMKCDIRYHIQREIYFFRGFEHAECREWLRRARDAKVIFDIGANVGIYSLLAARGNPEAQVHAFEPTQQIFDRLRDNVALNGLSNIALNSIGVSENVGVAYLHSCKGSDAENEGMNYVASDGGNDTLSVEVTSLDAYCARKGIERIDLLKIDIEGGEWAALAGARSLLQRRRIGCIFIELIDWAAQRSGHSRQDLADVLRSAGYDLFELKDGSLARVAKDSLPLSHNVIALLS